MEDDNKYHAINDYISQIIKAGLDKIRLVGSRSRRLIEITTVVRGPYGGGWRGRCLLAS